jgi:DNA-binding NarL/FixJ family response regulator
MTPHAPKWKILLVDDHPFVRACFSQLFSLEVDLDTCYEAGDAAEAMKAIEKHKPDLAIVDITLPDTHGLELVKDIRARFPETRILVFSMHDEDVYGQRAIRAGANGYMMKTENPERVVAAVHEVLAGRLAVSDALAQKLLNTMREGKKESSQADLANLSDRELEVFHLVGQGLGTREIAERLHRGVKTIETYRLRIKQKLGIETASELVAIAASWASRVS